MFTIDDERSGWISFMLQIACSIDVFMNLGVNSDSHITTTSVDEGKQAFMFANTKSENRSHALLIAEPCT